jgi:hypothetical protein
LPDVPVLKVLVDNSDTSGNCGGRPCSNSIFAGTDIGVFHSSDGGATWQPFNLGVIPAVPVYDLAQNNSGILFAGTHGRGAYELNLHPGATATTTATATATATATQVPTPSSTATPNGAKISAPKSEACKSTGIGQTSTKTFVIKNAGKKSGDLKGQVNLSSTAFSIAPTSFDIASGKSLTFTITFNPQGPTNTATATITSNDSTQPSVSMGLSGTGLPGKLSVSKSANLNGPVNQTTVVNLTLKNSGKGSLSGSWPNLSSGPYTVTAGVFGPIGPGKTSPLPITFKPTVKGKAPTATLTISVTAPGTGGTTVTLKGTGK